MSRSHSSDRARPTSRHRARDGTVVNVDGVEFTVPTGEVLAFVEALTSGDFTVAVDERDIDLKDVER